MNTSFWEQLETKQLIQKAEIEQYLIQKLGEPTTELQHNLLFELTKKIKYYYTEEPQQSYNTYSCLGSVSQIIEKRFKEGRRRGQVFYTVQLTDQTKFRALQEDLPGEK